MISRLSAVVHHFGRLWRPNSAVSLVCRTVVLSRRARRTNKKATLLGGRSVGAGRMCDGLMGDSPRAISHPFGAPLASKLACKASLSNVVLSRRARRTNKKATRLGGFFICLVGRDGFEPSTNWLKANCSTAELTAL